MKEKHRRNDKGQRVPLFFLIDIQIKIKYQNRQKDGESDIPGGTEIKKGRDVSRVSHWRALGLLKNVWTPPDQQAPPR